MHRIPRGLLSVCLSLSALGFTAWLTQPAVPPVVAAPMPATTTTAAVPPLPPTTTTTTAAPVVHANASPRPTTPPTTAAPVATRAGKEACGWTWDGIRIDDGSSNEVTLNLDAARRPNETVTLYADFAGPDSPTAARTVTTDSDGQASATFPVSEDKRDWTITISATFARGGACPAETFTLDY